MSCLLVALYKTSTECCLWWISWLSEGKFSSVEESNQSTYIPQSTGRGIVEISEAEELKGNGTASVHKGSGVKSTTYTATAKTMILDIFLHLSISPAALSSSLNYFPSHICIYLYLFASTAAYANNKPYFAGLCSPSYSILCFYNVFLLSCWVMSAHIVTFCVLPKSSIVAWQITEWKVDIGSLMRLRPG